MIFPPLSILWVAIAILAIGSGFLLRDRTEGEFLSKKPTLFIFSLILLCGGYLRFSVLDFGFPEYYHPDESTKSRVLRRMAEAQTLNPHYFLHPSLLLYSAKATSRVLREAGVYPHDDPHRYVLAGRFVSATAGTLAIGLIYLLLQGLGSPRRNTLSLAGAALVAFSPLHIACSRYFKEDALFTTLLLCVTLLSLSALRRNRLPVAAGFFSGLCAGAKYTGGVSIVLPLLVVAFQLGRQTPFFSRANLWTALRAGVTLGLVALLAFVMTTPYSVFSFSEFLNGILFEQRHVLGGHGGIAISAWSQLWTYHLSRSLQRGMGLIPLLLGLVGVGMALRRRKPEDLLLLFALGAFYAAAEYVKAKPMPQPDRYALPAFLFLSTFVAQSLNALPGRRLATIIFGLLMTYSAYLGFRERAHVTPDTREKMGQWIETNIPKSSKMVLVGLPYYAPRLSWKGYKLRVLRPENDRARHTVENLKQSPHDYLLVTSLSYDRFFSQPFADEELKARFLAYDSSFELVHEESVPEGSFGFHNPTLKLYKLR